MLQEKEKKVERDRRKEGRVKGAGKLGGISDRKRKDKSRRAEQRRHEEKQEEKKGGIGKLLQETAK